MFLFSFFFFTSSVNPQAVTFRQKLGSNEANKYFTPKLIQKLVSPSDSTSSHSTLKPDYNKIAFSPPVFYMYKKNVITTTATGSTIATSCRYLIRGDFKGCISLWSLNSTQMPGNQFFYSIKIVRELIQTNFWTKMNRCKQKAQLRNVFEQILARKLQDWRRKCINCLFYSIA